MLKYEIENYLKAVEHAKLTIERFYMINLQDRTPPDYADVNLAREFLKLAKKEIPNEPA